MNEDSIFFSRGLMSDSSDPFKIYTNPFSLTNGFIMPFVDRGSDVRKDTSNFTRPKPENECISAKLNEILKTRKEFNVKSLKIQQE